MRKFVVEVLEGQRLTAGSKAKEDIVNFLKEEQYEKLSLSVPKSKIKRVLFGNFYWKRSLKNVSDGDAVVYQYPAYSRILGDYFIKNIKKKKNICKIVVVHDLDSLRIYQNQFKNIQRELSFLNQFDVVICHNEVMKKWLVENGCDKEIVVLGIFDYLEYLPIKENKNSETIVFAGNLGKSNFLDKIECKTKINLYGIAPSQNYPSNITYNGAFLPEELGKYLEGGFGLVWDGDSIDTCTGTTGNYMRYNNPHKTSLYLAMGIPVIIWKEAALADFIEKNRLGVTLDSLGDLDDRMAKISEEEYEIIKKNTIEIAEEIRKGLFIKKAVNKAIAKSIGC